VYEVFENNVIMTILRSRQNDQLWMQYRSCSAATVDLVPPWGTRRIGASRLGRIAEGASARSLGMSLASNDVIATAVYGENKRSLIADFNITLSYLERKLDRQLDRPRK